MRLEKGSSLRLFASMCLSGAIGFSALIAAKGSHSSLAFYLSMVVLLYCVNGFSIAFRLIDAPGPLVSAGPNGLVFNRVLSKRGLIPWEEVRSLKTFRPRWYLIHIPWLTQLVVRTGNAAGFGPLLRWLPLGWSARFWLPARCAEGGATAVEQFVALAHLAREEARHALVSGERDAQVQPKALWHSLHGLALPVEDAHRTTADLALAAQEQAAAQSAGIGRFAPAAALREPESRLVPALAGEPRRVLPPPAPPAPPPAAPKPPVLLNGKPLKY